VLLKYFYDDALAHASYLVGCQKTGQAMVIDPSRAVRQYIDVANAHGLKVVGAADTHIHADYVSGARQLADQYGAKLYVSDEGPAEWKFEYASKYEHQLLKDGDEFSVGEVELRVLHMPGHTPESVSFVLTDRGGGADEPMGIFTGDFVFVGSVGRPDLLEEAAGMMGTAATGARDLYKSIARFKQLPDFMQVWPAHGAGSACGKGLGAIPSSTVGYEKRFNPAFRIESEEAFVNYLLSDQPAAPKYFSMMKRMNRVGPTVIAEGDCPAKLVSDQLPAAARESMVIDTRTSGEFARGHAPETINVPTEHLAAWAGWLVNYEEPVFLATSKEDLAESVRLLREIGIDHISGYFDVEEVANYGLLDETYPDKSPAELVGQIERNEVVLIDVRGDTEWNESHIGKAQRCFLADLPARLAEFDGPCALVFHCRSGARSAIACSLAQAAGVQAVINMIGGIKAWEEAGLEIESCENSCSGPTHEATENELACQSQAVFWSAQCPSEVL
jgi:hydroxyacylglutathione hydrolase